MNTEKEKIKNENLSKFQHIHENLKEHIKICVLKLEEITMYCDILYKLPDTLPDDEIKIENPRSVYEAFENIETDVLNLSRKLAFISSHLEYVIGK